MVWGGRLVADWMECWGFNLLGLTMKIGLTVCWVERLKCLPIWFYKIMKDCFFSSWANFAVPVEETQQWVEKTQQWVCTKQMQTQSSLCTRFDSSFAEHNDSKGQLVHNIHIAQWNLLTIVLLTSCLWHIITIRSTWTKNNLPFFHAQIATFPHHSFQPLFLQNAQSSVLQHSVLVMQLRC